MIIEIIRLFEDVKAIILPDIFAIRITAKSEEQLSYGKTYFENLLTSLNGGSSVTRSSGSSISGMGTVDREHNYLIEVNTHDSLALFFKVGPALVDWLKQNDQETIWIRFGNVAIIATVDQLQAAHNLLIKRKAKEIRRRQI